MASEQAKLIRLLQDSLSTEALVGRFGVESVTGVLGDRITKELSAKFAQQVEAAFNNSAAEMRQRLAGATGNVRQAIVDAIDKIALRREDLTTGVPAALRAIQDNVSKRLENIGNAIDDQTVELRKKIEQANKDLQAAYDLPTDTDEAGMVRVQAQGRAFIEIDALKKQLKEVQKLRTDIHEGTREALEAAGQEVVVIKAANRLTESLANQAAQIGKTSTELQRYNAELQLTDAIAAVGAQGIDAAADAHKRLAEALKALEATQAADALKTFGNQVAEIRKRLAGESVKLILTTDEQALLNIQQQMRNLFKELGDDSEEAAAEFDRLKESVEGVFRFLQGTRRFVAFKDTTRDVLELVAALDRESEAMGMTDAERTRAEALAGVTAQFAELEAKAKAAVAAGDPKAQADLAKIYFGQAIALEEVNAALDRRADAESVKNQKAGQQAIVAQVLAIQDQTNALGLNSDQVRRLNALKETTRILDEAGIEDLRTREEALTRVSQALLEQAFTQDKVNQVEAIQATQDATAAFQEQIDTIGLSGVALQRYNALQRLRIDLDKSGALHTREGAAALAEAKAKFDELAQIRELKSIFDEVGRSLGDAFVDFITGAKSAEDALKSFLENVSKAILQKAVTGLIGGAIGSIFGGITGGGGGGFAKGGVFDQSGVTAFARGGVVNGPTVFPFANGIGLMGEKGPEVILPLKRGPDGSLGVEAPGTGGGPPTVVVHMTVVAKDPASFRGSERQIAGSLRKRIGKG